MIHGIINVYKEAGYTSFDVVAKLRGILKQKKIGHTGTLDPAAEGVLPVCLGNGTKLCELLTDKTKEYEAVLLLGKTTDTQDTTGAVLSERTVDCTEEEVRTAIMSFVGAYEQIPPMYSALKIDGKRLYELARDGKTVERKGRRIEIYEIEICSVQLPRVTYRVRCSKGTYIRTLCQDIGEKLGCGGCMEHLLRTRSGSYGIDDSLTLREIEEARDQDRLEAIVQPLESAFDYPKLTVRPEGKKKIDNGNPMGAELFFETGQCAPSSGQRYWVYDAQGELAAIYIYNEQTRLFMPDKMFPRIP
ncbi:MAG: tRNA pseudouridine(55) synthase TruB [Lachnospiraceae bacterium]|nr:tRNA pseudouridine(55) synthase TruB [Lachnospiraceae bacterium]